jgi:hypothetical protein
MDTCWRRIVIIGALLAMACPVRAQSDLFRCKQADGSIKFSDHGGPGCRKLDESKDLQPLNKSQSLADPLSIEEDDRSSPSDPAPSTPGPRGPSSAAFQPATRTVASLVVGRSESEEAKARGKAYVPAFGDYASIDLTVSHIPQGNGPKVGVSHHFGETARVALGIAALAAVHATHYDPRFLRVELVLPTTFLATGVRIDGPSAGMGWAVAVASAILGDPLRSDICMTGTISPDLKVGPIGGLEKKIEGCHGMRRQEVIFPAGQKTFTVLDKGQARSMKLTEAATLAEAYRAATGQELRPAQ